MHACYWQDSALLAKPWLRASAWYVGAEEAKWIAAQEQAKTAWGKIRNDIDAGKSTINWNEHLVACLDASFAKLDWRTYQVALTAHPFTLVHGDAHAHNFMWVQ